MKRAIIISVVLLTGSLFIQCGGKKKVDPAKYTEYCTEVAKCDKQIKNMGPTGVALCTKVMAKVEEDREEAVVKQIQECEAAQSCEQKQIMTCIQQHMASFAIPQ